VDKALNSRRFGSYTLQAAIAAVRAEAKSATIVGELGGRAVRCRLGEVASGFGLHATEYVGRAATFMLRVAPQPLHWPHRSGRAQIGMQNQQCDPDFGNSARYAVSICSILNPPSLMREGISRVM
jgi:hypothetical protein